MASSDNEVAGLAPSEPDSEIAGDGPDAVSRRCRPAPAPLVCNGPLQLYVVVMSSTGLWQAVKSDLNCWPEELEGTRLVGFVLAESWSFVRKGYKAFSEVHKSLHYFLARKFQGRNIFGFIDYQIHSVAEFAEPIEVNMEAVQASLRGFMGEEIHVRGPAGDVHRTRLSAVIEEWQAFSRRVWPVVCLSPGFALHVMRGSCPTLHSVAITRKTNRRMLLIPQVPSRRQLARFIQDEIARCAPQQLESPHVRLPAWASFMTEPGEVIDWLDSSSHIRDQREIKTATLAFSRIFARFSKRSRHELTKDIKFIDYKTLRQARVRLDVLSMLVFGVSGRS